MYRIPYQSASGQNRQKNSLKECVFNSALKIQCHIVKSTLLQTAFSAISPTDTDTDLNKYSKYSFPLLLLKNHFNECLPNLVPRAFCSFFYKLLKKRQKALGG